MNRSLRVLQRIEAQCYPRHMRMICECESWDDLCDYAEGKVKVHFFGGSGREYGYLLVTADEIVDLACTRSPGVADIWSALKFLREHFGEQWVEADLRERTSYPLVKALARAGRLALREGTSWEWGGETMIEVSLKVVR